MSIKIICYHSKIILFRKAFISLLLINSIFLTSLNAQQKDSCIFSTIWGDVKISVNDGICTYSSPLHFNTTDWIKSSAVILTTAAFMPLDKDIRKEFSKNHNDSKDKIADIGNAYGNLIMPVVVGGGIYSYGLFFKNDYVRETGRMLFEAVLFSGIITDVTKVIAGRSRPYTERGPYFFNMFTFDEGSISFPSGHTTVAFAMSSVLANRIKNIFATIGLYTLSSVTALSRIYSDKHWASDVLLGSAIGYFVGDYISSDKKNCNKKNKISYNIYPEINGLCFKLCF
jgi:membrane-associated phospholipid phosphatase